MAASETQGTYTVVMLKDKQPSIYDHQPLFTCWTAKFATLDVSSICQF